MNEELNVVEEMPTVVDSSRAPLSTGAKIGLIGGGIATLGAAVAAFFLVRHFRAKKAARNTPVEGDSKTEEAN